MGLKEHRAGFHIGKYKLNDVVNHGVVQGGWALESGEVTEDNQVIILDDEHSTTFAISIASASYGNQFFSGSTFYSLVRKNHIYFSNVIQFLKLSSKTMTL